MKVTDITQQSKRQDRYSIYIDDQFAFGVSENHLLRIGLYKGQEITETELETFRQEAETDKAYNQSLNYISIRPRSEREITDYLKRKGYSTEVSSIVVDKLRELQLLDDAAFARSWVQWRQSDSPRSRRKLYDELQKKGVANEIIEDALEAIDEEEQIEALRGLIAKKRHRYSTRQKLMAYLSRQGFPYDLIQKTLEGEEE